MIPHPSTTSTTPSTIRGLAFRILECNGTFSIRAVHPPCPLLTEDGRWAHSFDESMNFHRWKTRRAAEEAARQFADSNAQWRLFA